MIRILAAAAVLAGCAPLPPAPAAVRVGGADFLQGVGRSEKDARRGLRAAAERRLEELREDYRRATIMDYDPRHCEGCFAPPPPAFWAVLDAAALAPEREGRSVRVRVPVAAFETAVLALSGGDAKLAAFLQSRRR